MSLSGEREGTRRLSRSAPEESVVEFRAGIDPTAGEQTAGDSRTLAQDRAVPDRAAQDADPSSELATADHRMGDRGAAEWDGRENPKTGIKGAGAVGKGATPNERFERRAEEIARSAEVGERPGMREPSDFLAVREERIPQIVDQRALSRTDPREKPRGEDTDTGVEERRGGLGPAAPREGAAGAGVTSPAAPREGAAGVGVTGGSGAEGRGRGSEMSSETRDAVPFGLKRRVPVGLPVRNDEKSGQPAAVPVGAGEGVVVGLDRGVGVDDKKIFSGKHFFGIFETAGGAEDPGLEEEAELREFRRAVDQVLLDLLTQMVEIDSRLRHTSAAEPREVRPRERNVEKREERLRNPLGDGTKAHAAAGREEESAQRISPEKNSGDGA